jgi:probable phosphoglycerate mutase
MTAAPLSAALNVPLTLRADLQERNYGDIRGLAYDEVGANILDPDYDPPGGETWREFHQRVDGAWGFLAKMARELPDESTDSVVVVTHGLVLHALVSRLLDTSRLTHVPVGFANTSVTTVERLPPWRVAKLNCTAHLD